MYRSVTLKRFVFGCVSLCLIATALWLGVQRKGALPSNPQHAISQQMARASFSQLPLRFEANRGQTDAQVRFLARGLRQQVFLTPHSAVMAVQNVAAEKRQPGVPSLNDRPAKATTTVVGMNLVNANPAVRVIEMEELPGRSHYLIGNDPQQWRTNITNYARVKHEAVYPGIDLVWYGNEQQLEYDFRLAPGADPRQIALSFTGADAIRLDAGGDLILSTSAGEVRQRKPVIYQESGGNRRLIAGQYTIRNSTIAFDIAAYDPALPLVIDPIILYSTFLGGTQDNYFGGLYIGDFASDVAVDAAGNACVTGYSHGADFPTEKPLQAARKAAPDAVVFKLNPAGNTLVYATYLGGNSFDTAGGIAVDNTGNVYLTGATESADFPTVRPLQGTIRKGAGFGDAFIAKLNTDGSALVYSTFFGGSGAETGSSIAVDAEGNAYVTGATFGSTDLPLEKPFQASYGGGTCDFDGFPLPCPDAFVAKLNPAGSALLYSTYLGGNQYEISTGLAVDAQGQVTIAGGTSSANFPTRNAIKSTLTGGGCNDFSCADAFVTKLTADGSALVFSTYLGGAQPIIGKQTAIDLAMGVAADNSGNSYITGLTLSSDFPLRSALRTTNVNVDAFVTKFDPAGALVYSTFLGGSGVENAYHLPISLYSLIGDGFNHCIAADAAGNAYVTGYTSSNDFPVKEAAQDKMRGRDDAFVTKLGPTGALVWSTYLGGDSPDDAFGIAADAAGNAYVVGVTNSANFPVVNPRQATLRGYGDIFVTKLGGSNLNPASVASVSAASFSGQALATESIVAAFGTRLATTTQSAGTTPLPTTLASVSVKVKDSMGLERLAPLFFISPNQINCQIPAGTAPGAATITVTSGDGTISTGTAQIVLVSPGLFTANADGQGVAAVVVLRVKPDGAQSFEPAFRFDSALNRFVAVPIELGAETDQVILMLNGTGLRFHSGLSAVVVRVGGTDAEVIFAGAQSQFVGLDQVNVRLPRSLAGRGDVDVALTVDSQAANVVRVNIK